MNNKELILEKSIKLFLQKGYHGTTIKDITDAVGITKGAFYWYYKSKEELLETLIDYFESAFTDTIIREVNNVQGGFLQKMKYSHKWATEFAYHHRDLCMGFLTLSAEMVGDNTEIEKKIQKVHKKYHNFLKGLLELGKKEGLVRDDLDIDILSNVINALHNGILFEWHMTYNEIDAALLARTFRNVSLKGILKEGVR